MNGLVEIEKLAKEHKPIKDTANPADLCFYWTMRAVYDCYRVKKLSTDEAKTAKQQAYMMHERFTGTLKNALVANVYREEAIRKMNCVGSDMHKAGSLEDKYRRALKAISAVTGETITENVEIRWLEGENRNESVRSENTTAESEERG